LSEKKQNKNKVKSLPIMEHKAIFIRPFIGAENSSTRCVIPAQAGIFGERNKNKLKNLRVMEHKAISIRPFIGAENSSTRCVIPAQAGIFGEGK
jgi:hypothetical protein